ncbi:MAG: hypothetical protein Kow0069_10320 [Promethearchaeota archaeon]
MSFEVMTAESFVCHLLVRFSSQDDAVVFWECANVDLPKSLKGGRAKTSIKREGNVVSFTVEAVDQSAMRAGVATVVRTVEVLEKTSRLLERT